VGKWDGSNVASPGEVIWENGIVG
jgi:hypothetical protein